MLDVDGFAVDVGVPDVDGFVVGSTTGATVGVAVGVSVATGSSAGLPNTLMQALFRSYYTPSTDIAVLSYHLASSAK